MKSISTVVAGLLTLAGMGFPLNPSFTPEAVKAYKAKADSGDAEAQYLYSYALGTGCGVARNSQQDFLYVKKAADQGYKRAFRRLAYRYEKGIGVEADPEKAEEYYHEYVLWAQKAARQGDADAMVNLALCYESGKGGVKNLAKALGHLRTAAEMGSCMAQTTLA